MYITVPCGIRSQDRGHRTPLFRVVTIIGMLLRLGSTASTTYEYTTAFLPLPLLPAPLSLILFVPTIAECPNSGLPLPIHKPAHFPLTVFTRASL
jgi:hypothetical protein